MNTITSGTRHLVDPQVLPLLDIFPELEFSDEAMPAIRQAFSAAMPPAPPLPAGVSQDEIMIPGRPGEPDVRCLRFLPASDPIGTLVQFHGGGMIMGAPEHTAPKNAQLCAQLGVRVLAPAYRLSPEHRAPAAVMDGLATLLFAAKDTALSRIVVSGDSAGGLMAISTVAAAREHLSGPIAGLHLVYPMLDPVTGGPRRPALHNTGEFIWTAQSNQYAWRAYLNGMDPADAHVPAALLQLDGLPPTWIGTGGLDLFLAENMRFAERLTEQGIPTELVVYPGVPHAFPAIAGADITQRFERDYRAALSRMLAG